MVTLLQAWERTDQLRREIQQQQKQRIQQSREAYGEVVRSHRLQAGWSMQQVADQVGCSTPMISDIEHGKRFPSRKLAARISDLFTNEGVDPTPS